MVFPDILCHIDVYNLDGEKYIDHYNPHKDTFWHFLSKLNYFDKLEVTVIRAENKSYYKANSMDGGDSHSHSHSHGDMNSQVLNKKKVVRFLSPPVAKLD